MGWLEQMRIGWKERALALALGSLGHREVEERGFAGRLQPGGERAAE